MSVETPQKFTVTLKHTEEGAFIAHCIEVPLSCQGKTKEEALQKMKEAIESTGWKLKQTH
jgi:predicted RNase H-like HicB family nuclease